MTYCKKCGAMLQPGMKFCTKCGQPIDLQPQAPTQPQGVSKPQRPQPLKAMAPQQPMKPQPMRPQAPGMPPKPMQPQRPVIPQAPQSPQAPQTPQASKGMFTNAVRSVANAMTGGALNRQIAEEQRRAVNQQATESQSEIRDARNAQQQAEQAQIAAEREAERSRDRRSMEAVDGVDVVRGKTIWNIQPGEIARKISERELDEIEKLKGIIVQEGCTAIIFANGELVSTLSAGAYLFYKSVEEEQAAIKNAVEKAEKDMAEAEKRERDRKRQAEPTFRQLGIVGEVGRGFNWLGRIIFGEKKGEQKEKAKKRQLDYARILARITQAPILSVYIVSNRFITLTFGGAMNENGELAFQPYTIPMGIHDVQIGVSLQMSISDIHTFATNYLTDHNSVTTRELQQLLNGTVETLLRQELRNQNYESAGLTAETVNVLKEKIRQTINQQVFGIECTQVLNITDSNQDFERFRQVERQLYTLRRNSTSCTAPENSETEWKLRPTPSRFLLHKTPRICAMPSRASTKTSCSTMMSWRNSSRCSKARSASARQRLRKRSSKPWKTSARTVWSSRKKWKCSKMNLHTRRFLVRKSRKSCASRASRTSTQPVSRQNGHSMIPVPTTTGNVKIWNAAVTGASKMKSVNASGCWKKRNTTETSTARRRRMITTSSR